MNIEQVEAVLRGAWVRESSYCPDEWSELNPARGQCVVSALIIQDLLGGDLKRYKVWFGSKQEKHYVNVLPDGQVADIARSQYPANTVLEESEPDLHGFESVREKLMNDEHTRHRYEILRSHLAGLD